MIDSFTHLSPRWPSLIMQLPGSSTFFTFLLSWRNGQGEAGLVVISTEETLSVSRVINQVIPVREWRQQAIIVICAPKGPWKLPLTHEQICAWVASPTFYDLMDWEQRWSGNFKYVEDNLIDKLDSLMSEGNGHKTYSELFNSIPLNKIEQETWRESGVSLIATVTCLMERLLDSRNFSASWTQGTYWSRNWKTKFFRVSDPLYLSWNQKTPSNNVVDKACLATPQILLGLFSSY